MDGKRKQQSKQLKSAKPFQHIVIDDFLPAAHASLLKQLFPDTSHPVWLDWQTRSPAQWGKQGAGDSRNFATLDPRFRLALMEFNNAEFLNYLGEVSGIPKLIPDPYFTGGAMHQIIEGGILDIHTDFNYYERLGIYRRINVLLYLNDDWRDDFGGCLELWDKSPKLMGQCTQSIAPIYNRAVIFKTDKNSFHGHPQKWNAPTGVTRKSIALYYYTAQPEDGSIYNQNTDFQGVVSKPLPNKWKSILSRLKKSVIR